MILFLSILLFNIHFYNALENIEKSRCRSRYEIRLEVNLGICSFICQGISTRR